MSWRATGISGRFSFSWRSRWSTSRSCCWSIRRRCARWCTAGTAGGPRPMTTSRLSVRAPLPLGLVAGPAALAASCGWDGGRVIAPRLKAFSRVNDWVGEKIFLSPHHLAPQYPRSQRTAPRDFPAYAQTHPLPQPRDGESCALAVGGLVQKPARLTLQMLHALPRLTYTVKHHCVEGWTAIATWTGVPLSAVIALVEPTPAARYLRLDSFDNGYYNGWDLKSGLYAHDILAYTW